MKSKIFYMRLISLSVLLVLSVLGCAAAPMVPGDTASRDPISTRDLSTEDLFKVMLLHDTSLHLPPSPAAAPATAVASTSHAAAGEGSSINRLLASIRMPSWLDYSATQPTLVTFDPARPPVRLSHHADDIERAINSHAFNNYYLRLNRLDAASRPESTTWLETLHDLFRQVSYATRYAAAKQLAREGTQAKESARQWALRLAQKQGGGAVLEAEIEQSLAKTWWWWKRGFTEATGYGMSVLTTDKPKVVRR
ncbi:uncharacterized protein SRS1_16112 [Sporisorium reilianum f. sp. reilianum]|uniref:Uncharacterized protein n=1 Tax=Sporisorium reilianum f. sp. reilianum TaxID=72559 RepID=A0A2N8UKI4_9BASI|nr:uncharacterized protein SRS1_16112 [Sporisorium reilianum f. sp. reilianum]